MPARMLMESKFRLALAWSTAARSVHVLAEERQAGSARLLSGRSRVSVTENVAACPRAQHARVRRIAAQAGVFMGGHLRRYMAGHWKTSKALSISRCAWCVKHQLTTPAPPRPTDTPAPPWSIPARQSESSSPPPFQL